MSASWGQPWTSRAASRLRTVYPQADLRVSDAERAEAADHLAEHYADGRLDQTEFSERLDRAMAAKTQADLRALFADLPPKHEPAPPAKPPAEVRRERRPSPLGRLMRVGLLVVAVLVVASVVNGMLHSLFFWPLQWWVVVGLIVLLVWRFGPRRR